MDDQQQSRQLLWTVGIVAVIVGACIFLAYVHEWKWTGLVKNPDFHKRTLWDWLNLLIVPAVLALGGYLFTRSESQRARETAEKERTVDREIADERRQDDMLQAYLDGMSQLLTDKERPLHRAELGDYLSTMARARTTTVLQRLKGERKGSVVQFLYESGLITTTHTVLTLRGADLGGANLIRADLSGANLHGADLTDAILTLAVLSGANLREANLSGANLHANLSGADLREAYLRGADLRGANLSGANLREATLYKANLREATLYGADLHRANLSDADLSGARGANLSGANLREAYLIRANLIRADLSGANLHDANLTDAILNGADLSDAEGVTEEQLGRQTTNLEGATMPNGQKYEDWLKSKGRGEEGENGGPS